MNICKAKDCYIPKPNRIITRTELWGAVRESNKKRPSCGRFCTQRSLNQSLGLVILDSVVINPDASSLIYYNSSSEEK